LPEAINQILVHIESLGNPIGISMHVSNLSSSKNPQNQFALTSVLGGVKSILIVMVNNCWYGFGLIKPVMMSFARSGY